MSLLTQAELDAVKNDIEQATGMPNSAYNSPESLAFERDHVFTPTWAALAFTSELPQDGYVKPVDFMGLPLVIFRNQSGDIQVFHNVCSHRGMRLVQEEKAVPTMLVCPYHSWTYNLDGELKATPHIGGVNIHQTDSMDCSKHGLKAVRSHIWMDMVFINLSGDAPEFNTYAKPLTQRWEEFVGPDGFDLLRVPEDFSALDIEVKCNWKLAVENYSESYHLPYIHPGLNSYSKMEDHYNIMVEDRFSGQGSVAYTLSETAGTQLDSFPDWPLEKLSTAEYITFYPNVLLGLQADHAFAMILEPTAHDRTTERLQIYTVGEESTQESHAQCRAATLEAWREVFNEDVFVVEGMQQGRNSPAYNGGVFSPVMDNASHHFHQWVAAKYALAI